MEWWSQETGTLIGALGGAGLGLVGGLYGAVVGVLAGRGVGGRAVLAIHITILVLGIVMLGAGIVAWIAGQPYHVLFPLLLIGAVASSVFGVLLPAVRKRYA